MDARRRQTYRAHTRQPTAGPAQFRLPHPTTRKKSIASILSLSSSALCLPLQPRRLPHLCTQQPATSSSSTTDNKTTKQHHHHHHQKLALQIPAAQLSSAQPNPAPPKKQRRVSCSSDGNPKDCRPSQPECPPTQPQRPPDLDSVRTATEESLEEPPLLPLSVSSISSSSPHSPPPAASHRLQNPGANCSRVAPLWTRPAVTPPLAPANHRSAPPSVTRPSCSHSPSLALTGAHLPSLAVTSSHSHSLSSYASPPPPLFLLLPPCCRRSSLASCSSFSIQPPRPLLSSLRRSRGLRPLAVSHPR